MSVVLFPHQDGPSGSVPCREAPLHTSAGRRHNPARDGHSTPGTTSETLQTVRTEAQRLRRARAWGPPTEMRKFESMHALKGLWGIISSGLSKTFLLWLDRLALFGAGC